jgi:hypothetical protein
MSDFRAIGGVSASLQKLLQDRMDMPDGVSSVPVIVGTPRVSKDDAPAKEDPRINIFLYRVSEDGFRQNQEIPGQGSGGAYGHPPLSLDLHYFVTAFGNTQVQSNGTALFDETTAQFLLGSAMRVLHDYAILTDELFTVRPPIGVPILHPSLLDAYEKLKLVLEPISLEDATKVWTALTLRYRLSAAYSVALIQIESKAKRTFPRIVGAPPNAYPPLSPTPVLPGPYIPVRVFGNPYVADVHARWAGQTAEQTYPFAHIGDTLILIGSGFSGGSITLELDEVLVPVAPVSSSRIEVVVPDLVTPGGPIDPDKLLQPGARNVSVIVADPAFPQGAVRSNLAVFMLVPQINAPVAYAGGHPRTITIQGTRLYSPSLSGQAMIGRAAVDKTQFVPPSTAAQIVVPIPDTLPIRDVFALFSKALPDPVTLPAASTMQVTIQGTSVDITLPSGSIALEDLPAALVQAIQNAAAAAAIPPGTLTPPFSGLRATLMGSQIVLLAGGLTANITAADSGGGTLATFLGLNGAQPAGATNIYLSGDLSLFPSFSRTSLGVNVQIGAAADVIFAPPTYLDDAATVLQAAIRAASPAPGFAGMLVGELGTQLLFVPGAASAITFSATAADADTVSILQLRAGYNVRVRVNGAESIDNAAVELPQ